MKLLFDIGNTYTNIGYWNRSSLTNPKNIATKNLEGEISKFQNKLINEIYLTSVILPKTLQKIKKQINNDIGSNITEIKSNRKLLNVTNGYRIPEKLGNDRWVSAVGMYLTYKSSLCILDCGTAISIDFINDNGKHVGGFIFSGPHGYSASFGFANNLKNIKLPPMTLSQKKITPSKSTEEAISDGYVLMILSAIERTYKDYSQKLKKKPLLLITGGYGEIISRKLSLKNSYIPNLVLKSLGVISDHVEK